MFQRLLVPLDGSRLAESVLPLVERLAGLEDASVLLLHVLERGAPSQIHGQTHLATLPSAVAYLQGIVARLRAQGVAVEYHAHEVPEGDVARSIIQHAAERDTDLIVLATHGSGGMRQILSGSIAQQVLRRGARPVLLGRAESPAPQPFAPNRILVPLDATAGAEVALEPAAQLARELGAALHLVMVVATPETVRGDRAASAALLPAAARAALDLEHRDAERYLEQLAEGLRVRGLPVTTEVRRGDIVAALTDEAAEPEVGLVVVATHGRAGLQAIWAGSVMAKLLSSLKAPVLLLRTID